MYFRTVSNDTAPYRKAHTYTHSHTQTFILLLEKRKSVSQVFSSVPLHCLALGQSHHIINMVGAIVITSTKQKHSLTWQHHGLHMKRGAIKYVWGWVNDGVWCGRVWEGNKWEWERAESSYWKITWGRQWMCKSLRLKNIYTYAVGVIYIYAGERKRLDEKPPKALWRFHLNTEWETGACMCL